MFLITLISTLALAALVQQILTRRVLRRLHAPGTFINGLHVHQSGAGAPAVVFESGLGASCLSWSMVQSQLAGHAATYSYDRAGFGWSSSEGSSPCLLERRAQDLHALLQALDVPRPCIIVAHSFGAYIVRCHAQHHPHDISGIVLVDPLTPEEWTNPTTDQLNRLRRAVFFNRVAGVLAFFGVVRLGLWLLLRSRQATPGPISRHSETLRRIREELRKFPPEVVPLIRAHWARPKFYWAMAANLRELHACAAVATRCVIPAHIAVTVLSGAHQLPERLAEHAALANNSQHGRHIICKSAHYMHLDEPELIVNEVLKIRIATAEEKARRE